MKRAAQLRCFPVFAPCATWKFSALLPKCNAKTKWQATEHWFQSPSWTGLPRLRPDQRLGRLSCHGAAATTRLKGSWRTIAIPLACPNKLVDSPVLIDKYGRSCQHDFGGCCPYDAGNLVIEGIAWVRGRYQRCPCKHSSHLQRSAFLSRRYLFSYSCLERSPCAKRYLQQQHIDRDCGKLNKAYDQLSNDSRTIDCQAGKIGHLSSDITQCSIKLGQFQVDFILEDWNQQHATKTGSWKAHYQCCFECH